MSCARASGVRAQASGRGGARVRVPRGRWRAAVPGLWRSASGAGRPGPPGDRRSSASSASTLAQPVTGRGLIAWASGSPSPRSSSRSGSNIVRHPRGVRQALLPTPSSCSRTSCGDWMSPSRTPSRIARSLPPPGLLQLETGRRWAHPCLFCVLQHAQSARGGSRISEAMAQIRYRVECEVLSGSPVPAVDGLPQDSANRGCRRASSNYR